MDMKAKPNCMNEKQKYYLWGISRSWTRTSISLRIALWVGRIASITSWVWRISTITCWRARRSLKNNFMKLKFQNMFLFYYINSIHFIGTWWNFTGRHQGNESLKTKVESDCFQNKTNLFNPTWVEGHATMMPYKHN